MTEREQKGSLWGGTSVVVFLFLGCVLFVYFFT